MSCSLWKYFTTLQMKAIAFFLAIGYVGCSPSDPTLKYEGVGAVQAIQMLDKAQNYEEKQIAIRKIETDRQAGFDWGYFWRGVGEGQRIASLSPDQRNRIFTLSAESCSMAGFESFAELVIKINTGFDFVFGEKRLCAQALSGQLFAKYVKFFYHEDVRLAELLINQYQLDDLQSKSTVLDQVSPQRWLQLSQVLVRKGEGQKVSRLIKMHQETYGSISFIESLMKSLIVKKGLTEALKSNELIDVLQILTADPTLRFFAQSVSRSHWKTAINQVKLKFLSDLERHNSESGRFNYFLKILHLMALLPERISSPPSLDEQLVWFEQALRGFENYSRSLPDLESLMDRAGSDPFVTWLKIRSNKEVRSVDELALRSYGPGPKLMQSLIFKIKMHLSKSDTLLKKQMSDYCTWLSKQGVPLRRIPGKDFDWSMTTIPGCIELSGATPEDNLLSFNLNSSLSMSFDSVLLARGWNIDLKVPYFDGAFIDMSTSLRHPDLLSEPALDKDHAIALPLLIGIRMNRPNTLSGLGTYYFVYHFSLRKAHDGRPAVQRPQAGYPGGSLRLNVREMEKTFSPRLVSFGGPGQKAVPPRPGGRASHSELAWTPLALSLSRSLGEEGIIASRPIPLPSPTLRVLHTLFSNAERGEDGNIKLFIEPERWLQALTAEQKRKALMICPAGSEDLTCWEQVTLQAAQELWTSYADLCPQVNSVRRCLPQKLEFTLARLNSNSFIEPAGALGPVNEDGAIGESGSLIVEEMR